ncbi:helix-turn-helix domain-containing protein [Streptomyces luteogriseus]|uniref:helix-turn-helix domain-containing protein n=1 Tax=Streptomyces luteogriseus TaxID=68233 RepID=UPI0036EC6D84
MSACPETERFAALLRSLKSRSGLSYEALARKSGLAGSTLHRYCRGTSVPQDYGSVHRLATVCGATPDELRTLHRLWALADAARAAATAATAAAATAAAAAGPGPAAGAGAGPGSVAGAGDDSSAGTGEQDDRAESEAEGRSRATDSAPDRAAGPAMDAPLGRDPVPGADAARGRDAEAGTDAALGRAAGPATDSALGRDPVPGAGAARGRNAETVTASASGRDTLPATDSALGRDPVPATDAARGRDPVPATDAARGRNAETVTASASGRDPVPAMDAAPGRDPVPATDAAPGRDTAPTTDAAPGLAPGRPGIEPSPRPTGWSRRRRLRTSVVTAAVVAAVSVSAWALTNGRDDEQGPSPSGGAGRGADEDRPLFSAGCSSVIAMGQHDECVREVQRLLHAKGADIGVDGDFGPQTLRRVTAFQVLAGLPPNGVVGEPTKKALYTSRVRMGVWSPQKVRQRVREAFPEVADKAVAIADCQSFLDPLHILPNTNGTRNWGLFQISDARLRELGGTPREALDPEWNIRAARKLWSRDRDFGDWPHCERAAEAPRSAATAHSGT